MTARMRQFTTYLRARWAEILIGTASIIAAGLIAAGFDGDQTTARIPVELHHPVPISGAGQSLAVSEVAVGTHLVADGSEPLVGGGVFVAVQFTLASPGDAPVRALTCVLDHDGHPAGPTFGSGVLVVPEPGFRRSEFFVFERPRDAVAGATVQCTLLETVRAYSPVYTFDLGLSDDDVRSVVEDRSEVHVTWLPVTEVLR